LLTATTKKANEQEAELTVSARSYLGDGGLSKMPIKKGYVDDLPAVIRQLNAFIASIFEGVYSSKSITVSFPN